MNEYLERTVERSAEHIAAHYYGKYSGVVTDIADPDDRCRIKARLPRLLDGQVTGWAEPALPFAGSGHGIVMLPKVGDGVWIEFEAGNLDQPIWTGCFFAAGARPEPRGERVRVIATESGHKVILDEENDEIRLVHPTGGTLTMSATEIVLALGACELKMSATEIALNNGMVKVTVAGVSLANNAMKLGV
jgi:uncharacterized protein involved in type VI secretion and phage assembly